MNIYSFGIKLVPRFIYEASTFTWAEIFLCPTKFATRVMHYKCITDIHLEFHREHFNQFFRPFGYFKYTLFSTGIASPDRFPQNVVIRFFTKTLIRSVHYKCITDPEIHVMHPRFGLNINLVTSILRFLFTNRFCSFSALICAVAWLQENSERWERARQSRTVRMDYN